MSYKNSNLKTADSFDRTARVLSGEALVRVVADVAYDANINPSDYLKDSVTPVGGE